MGAVTRITPHRISPRRDVPRSIRRPEYVDRKAPKPYRGSHVQPPEVVSAMRESGRIAADAMYEAARAIAPGVTTDQLDAIAHEYMLDHGAYPSALGYRGFPKSICTSVNEVICHGIPDDRELQEGDICNIDITAYIGGVHGDNNATFLAGEVAEDTRLLVVPGSVRVRMQAEQEGLHEIFLAAGAEWRGAGCSMCLGMNPDVLQPGERSASTSNRNFEGRQGKGGRTHLVSVPVAAATAVRGTLSSPADL